MNVYYNPEAFGLGMVGSIEWVGAMYEFDLTIVLKKTRGEYYLASDSGCSCPSPFEDVSFDNRLEGPYNKSALAFNLNRLLESHGNDEYSRPYGALSNEVRAILDRIK